VTYRRGLCYLAWDRYHSRGRKMRPTAHLGGQRRGPDQDTQPAIAKRRRRKTSWSAVPQLCGGNAKGGRQRVGLTPSRRRGLFGALCHYPVSANPIGRGFFFLLLTPEQGRAHRPRGLLSPLSHPHWEKPGQPASSPVVRIRPGRENDPTPRRRPSDPGFRAAPRMPKMTPGAILRRTGPNFGEAGRTHEHWR
jgi:hypothetical protein